MLGSSPPVASFKGGFQRALKEAGVLFASDGKKRVPYSLRHTYATMRLAEGVSVFQLAANMGIISRDARRILWQEANARPPYGDGADQTLETRRRRLIVQQLPR